jgi:hypothetical protein
MMRLTFLATVCAVACNAIEEFSVYTEPIELRHGEVHNSGVKPIRLPDWVVKKYAGRRMGVVKFQLDIVRFEGKKEVRVPLSEVYNHHTIQVMGTYAMMNETYQTWKRKDPLGPGPQGPQGLQSHAPHCGTSIGHITLSDGQYVHTLQKAEGHSSNGFNPYAMWMGPIGGAEFRDADRDLPGPYRAMVDSPEAMTAVLHFINTREGPGPDDYPRLFECPCTSERKIDLSKGTVDGVTPLAFHCSQELLFQKNPDCALAGYKGGYRCCEDGVFVVEHPKLEAPKDTVYGKFTFRIDDVTPATKAVLSQQIDVAGGNAEYSIEACDPSQGTVPRQDCVHVATFVQDFSAAPPGVHFELITARGHQHVGGLGMELYNERTGELLCASHPVHGTGPPTEAGNEGGFIVGTPPCVWGPAPLPPPPRFSRQDAVRVVSRYNSTETHHGVMGFWFHQYHMFSADSNSNSVLV